LQSALTSLPALSVQEDLIFSLESDEHKDGRKVDPNVQKLDELMCLMFEYLALIRKGKASMCDEVSLFCAFVCTSLSPVLAPRFSSLFCALSSGQCCVRTRFVFWSTVSFLGHHSPCVLLQSRFTQFLVFYYCSIKHVYAEAFIRRLAEKLLDHNTNSVERHNAASFIASFVSRASVLRHATAVSWFEVLLEWLHHYIDAQKKRSVHSPAFIDPFVSLRPLVLVLAALAALRS
jgi:hypothetical protein